MSPKVLVNPSSVVLVSGGARGITARCVIKLAQRSQCKFILLGRTPNGEVEPEWAQGCVDESELKKRIMQHLSQSGEKPTPAKVQSLFKKIQSQREIHETLHAVEEAGGQAEYVSVDITDSAALQSNLAGPVQRLGPVTGIIHGAGNLADKLIEKKSEKDFETVFSPKVDGLENLLHTVSPRQLDFLVLFSSIVGFYGNVGQADYAIANEVLNKTAYRIKRENPACHVVSIDWGPWDAGMVTPELKKAFAEKNVEIIPVDVGANLLVEELAPSNQDTVQVVMGTPPAYPAEELDAELRTYQIRRKLSLEANPFLYDHVIGESPVLPATCSATWVVNACEQLYPGYAFLSVDHYKVLKGIVFDENLADEYVLDLKEVAKSPQGRVAFDALIWSLNKRGRRIFHYSLGVTLVKQLPPAPLLDLPSTLAGPHSPPISGRELYKNGTLFHGASFQGVDQVLHVSPGKLVMQCILPEIDEHQQGQFPVQTANPFIYDAIVQCLLIWAQYSYQAPCLPSRLENLVQYRSIPFGEPCLVTMEVQSQSETSVVGDITVQDPSGQVYVEIKGLEGTISTLLKRFIGTGHNGTSENHVLNI